ncbi:Peroxisome biosynthesis protein pex1 [Oleoguttula sp. CCFEE 5521]
MAAPGRKPTATQAEVVPLPGLKNCLLNLPSSLVNLLLNSNAVVQNVVVELSFTPPPGSGPDSKAAPRSVYLGWTGMRSQAKSGSLIRRDGTGRPDQDVPTVEVDATFSKGLGLVGGMKVSVSLHLDPPLAHTVNIEPVGVTDWEIIELHARFLEMNFISQVRALPNPATGPGHPLTLHLSPTSTANILVTGLTPEVPATQPFVKLAPDAEVIVAPKTRQAARPTASRDSASVSGRRSVAGRSERGAVRPRSSHEAEKTRPPLFLRGITRALDSELLEVDDDIAGYGEFGDDGLRIWLDRALLSSQTLRGVTWATVSVVKPASFNEVPEQPVQSAQGGMPASRVVAKVCEWPDAPDSKHVVLSSLLCDVLSSPQLVGGVVRIEPAPPQLPKTASALKEPSQQASKDAIVKRLRITPFAAAAKAGGLKFGGESKAEKDAALQDFTRLCGKLLLSGPLTNGMLLPAISDWPGGMLDFDPVPSGDPSKSRIAWLHGGERKLELVIQPESTPPKIPKPPGESLPVIAPTMVAVKSILDRTRSSLASLSSVLITGGLGSGKTALTQLLAHEMRSLFLYHTTYISCCALVTEETRIKTIKDTLQRAFASAAWGARLGGRALVVLDDLDRLCPMETELQVDANGRSRQGKEALHGHIIGSHVVRDIVALKAPDKDGRRQVLDLLVREGSKPPAKPKSEQPQSSDVNEWMEDAHTEEYEQPDVDERDDDLDPQLDLLDIAGQTDGYMPGDLSVLVSRARTEALIRAVADDHPGEKVTIAAQDFTAALKGFTPASLRGVTLQSSTTTFASIGGLTETRKTLLETLQYPTTYAPLFAKCPLRLRSGLLLYGYPGCGKTLLASAVAGECGLNFISVKGPEILNKYIGASEKSVRDLFERAEAAKPCVLFFDEFDSIAPKRGHDSTGVTDRVVNMLLTMMDGAEGLSGVYVLAATSRPDLIDPALLRPGRLDKSLICDMPSEEDRLDILRAVSKQLKFDDYILHQDGRRTLREVAQRTTGYSGADLQAVVYNAHLEAIHDLLDATDTAIDGTTSQSKDHSHVKRQEFTYFRLGDHSPPNGHQQLAAVAAERAEIASKLAAMQLARRKAKEARHAAQQRPGTARNLVNGNHAVSESQEPVIRWQHLEKSLGNTRASISAQEQRRLSTIYREFVVGRNGEMSDGQGSSEVGGRTSLM